MKEKFYPHIPPKLEKAEVYAIKALAAGNANDLQQKIALRTIIEKICKTYDLPFFVNEDGARLTDFAAGKMFCGSQIVKCVNLDPALLESKAIIKK
jgi:hypothetical protein